MTKNNNAKTPIQQPLPLDYKGSPFIQRVQKKFGVTSEILNKASYWRSFTVWTNISINLSFSVFLFTIVYLNFRNIPPVIPVLYIFTRPSEILVPTEYLYALLTLHLVLQIFLMTYCARFYVKYRSFTNLSIILLTMAAFIFYIGFYKSIRMNF